MRREKEEKKKGRRREKGQISFHVSRLCTLQTSVVSCCNKNQNIVVVFLAPARHTLNIFFYMLLSYIFLLYCCCFCRPRPSHAQYIFVYIILIYFLYYCIVVVFAAPARHTLSSIWVNGTNLFLHHPPILSFLPHH